VSNEGILVELQADGSAKTLGLSGASPVSGITDGSILGVAGGKVSGVASASSSTAGEVTVDAATGHLKLNCPKTPYSLLAINGSGNMVAVPNNVPNKATTASAYTYKGNRFFNLGYGGSVGLGKWAKIYHGEGVASGSANMVTLKLSAMTYQPGYAEWIMQIILTQNTVLREFWISKLFSVREPATPELVLSGDATSYDVWLKLAYFWYYVEFLASDEVSANDTIPESAILSDTKPDDAIPLLVLAPTSQSI
jgi:hypothetical protein